MSRMSTASIPIVCGRALSSEARVSQRSTLQVQWFCCRGFKEVANEEALPRDAFTLHRDTKRLRCWVWACGLPAVTEIKVGATSFSDGPRWSMRVGVGFRFFWGGSKGVLSLVRVSPVPRGKELFLFCRQDFEVISYRKKIKPAAHSGLCLSAGRTTWSACLRSFGVRLKIWWV